VTEQRALVLAPQMGAQEVVYTLWALATLCNTHCTTPNTAHCTTACNTHPATHTPAEPLLCALLARMERVLSPELAAEPAPIILGASNIAKILWALSTLGRLPGIYFFSVWKKEGENTSIFS